MKHITSGGNAQPLAAGLSTVCFAAAPDVISNRKMEPKELKRKLDIVATSCMQLSRDLQSLDTQLSLNMDRKAIREIITNLHWAAENSTVIGFHQIGEALEDNMGTGLHD
ncbi:hypothetical protein P3339_17200 [Microbulbifer sp. MLAF003]|uniref:hypothetical protein n=1 Tax=Microbulbifer sp. MLAF003 TaxID=3032582 RepID=UPI0024AD8BC0|nr:hypothetical protein [Microbulbifer sp. MLAF003]WHI50168.1 hypothetical protein P3339_17200 [Microbulbifer sp. MLAF003]